MRSSLAVLVPHALAMLACTAEDLPPIREQSEWLILRAPADLEVCEGTFGMMEAEVLQIRATLAPGTSMIDYSWMPESHYDSDAFLCNTPGAWACTRPAKKSDDQRVYARTLAETHELVHAARALQLPSVLEEGLASLLEQPSTSDDLNIVSRDELLTALEAGSLQNASSGHGLYQRSAHFISFLFAEFGREKFIELEQRVGVANPDRGNDDRPLADWEAAFETTYGQPFADVWAAYEDYPDCSSAQFKLPLTACAMLEGASPSATLIPTYATEITPEAEFRLTFECSDDAVVGPYVFGDRQVARASMHVIAIDNAHDPRVDVQLTGHRDAGTRALFTSCGNCWEGAGALLTRSNLSRELDVPSGVYALILYQDMDVPGPVGIGVSY